MMNLHCSILFSFNKSDGLTWNWNEYKIETKFYSTASISNKNKSHKKGTGSISIKC